MAIQQFNDGESGASIRNKINANFVDLDERLAAREEIDLPALLGLLAPPIVSQPSGGMVASGSTRTLSVTTGPQVGQAPTLFQWQSFDGSEWTDIPSATSSTYTTPALTSDVTLRVKLSNAFGDTYSTIVTVSVLGFAVQPQSGDFYVGNNVTLTATSNLAGSSYRWQEWDGDAWQNITGATSGTYSVSGLALGDDGREFRCVISISGVQATSNTATITVFGITTQPTEEVTLEGVADTYTIATNQTSATYQWQRSTDGGTTWSDLAAETDSSLAVSGTQANNGRKYRCIVSFRGLTLTSNVVTRHVLFVASNPANREVFEGQTSTFTVQSSLSGSTYQWRKSTNGGSSWSDITGATSSSYTTPVLSRSNDNATVYSCVITHSFNVASTNAVVSVWNPLAIADLVDWIDPSGYLYQDRSDSPVTIAADGNPIGTIKSRKNNYYQAASDAARPVYRLTGLGAKPSIELDGVDDRISLAAIVGSPANKNCFYVFAVISSALKTSQSQIVLFSNPAAAGSSRISLTANDGGNSGAVACFSNNGSSSNTLTRASSAMSAYVPAVFTAEFLAASGTSHLRKNGVRVANGTYATPGPFTNEASAAAQLGAIQTTQFFQGHIGDVVIVATSTALSDADVVKINDFLRFKSGIA